MEIFNGVISEKISNLDYEFSGDINELNLPTPKKSLKGIWYNQNDISPNCCTLTACLGAFTDLTGYVFSLEERKKLWEEAKKQGASDSYGWYVSDAVNLVRKYVNTLGLGTFITVRTAYGSDVFYKAIKQGYSAIIIYKGNKEYNNDINDNGIVEETNLIGSSTYSHCIRNAWKDCVIGLDNYKGSENWINEYKIKNEIELYKNSVIGSSAFFFVEDVPTLPIDRKLIEKCKMQFIAVTKPSKDGQKPSGEIFYCNKNSEIITMNSAEYELKHQMLLDSKCVNISKDDLQNFKKI